MTIKAENSKKANQIYLIMNLMNIAFMVYMFVRVFGIVDLRHLQKNNMNWVIVIIFILLLNVLKKQASKNGGIGNPMQTNKKAKSIHWVGLGIFLFGLLGVAFLHLDKSFVFVALLAIPIDIIAIYIAHKNSFEEEENDLLDDFEIEDD